MFIGRLLLASALCVPTMAFANYTSDIKSKLPGVYGFVEAGQSVSTSTAVSSTNLFLPSTFNTSFGLNSSATSTNFNGGLGAGFSKIVAQNYFIGVMGKFNWVNASMVNSTLSTETNTNLLYQTNINVTLKNEFSILAKFGRVFDNRTFLYGLVGPSWGKFNISNDASYTQNIGNLISATVSNQRSSYNTGLLLGIGIEQMITPRISTALEYNYTDYGTLSYPRNSSSIFSVNGTPNSTTSFSTNTRVNARNNAAFLKVSYYPFDLA